MKIREDETRRSRIIYLPSNSSAADSLRTRQDGRKYLACKISHSFGVFLKTVQREPVVIKFNPLCKISDLVYLSRVNPAESSNDNAVANRIKIFGKE